MLRCGAPTAVCYLSHCSVVSIDGEVSAQGLPKEKQQHTLVKVELKVVDKHSTGDVREAGRDENCTSPCVISPAVRGWSVKVDCCWSQSSRERQGVKTGPRTGVKKEKRGSPSNEP